MHNSFLFHGFTQFWTLKRESHVQYIWINQNQKCVIFRNKMNPLLFWVIVYLLKENLNRITLATEVFTSSINRIERRLTVMQDDLTLLRRLEQIENMDIDDWNHSLFILVTYICQRIENSNIEKSWRYFSFWFSRMVVYFVFDITQLYLQIFPTGQKCFRSFNFWKNFRSISN